MEGHSICPLPEKKQSVSHIEKRCVEELKQQCFDHELQHGYLVLKHVEGMFRGLLRKITIGRIGITTCNDNCYEKLKGNKANAQP